jgi:hypothetical protein
MATVLCLTACREEAALIFVLVAAFFVWSVISMFRGKR